VEGDWLDTVIGLDDARVEVVMLQTPGGGTRLELSKFHEPVDERGSEAAPANQLGLRNIAFAVDDIHATADRLKADGFGLVGAPSGFTRTSTGCATCGVPKESSSR
jgi:4-hydroxyphenylpyruvate dioxygenase-like putative hemolysin